MVYHRLKSVLHYFSNTMKNISRPLINLALILFIIGIFASLYSVFFVMPEALLQKIGISHTDHTKLDIAKEAAVQTLVIVGLELMIGLGLIITLLANNRKFVGTENIVYITNTIDNKQDKTATDTQENEDAILHAKIEDLKTIIEAQSNMKQKMEKGLNELCQLLEASIGALFLSKEIHSRKYIEFLTGYAFQLPDTQTLTYEYGEGISGQVAKSGKEIIISKVPDGYITVISGLGKATPQYMLAMPILRDGVLLGVLEIASFSSFSTTKINAAREIAATMGKYINIEVKGVVLGKS